MFLGGKPPNPLGRLRRVLGLEMSSAKQNNAFCFFFWKKKVSIRSIDVLLGAKSLGLFLRYFGIGILRSRKTLFASFSGNRRALTNSIGFNNFGLRKKKWLFVYI
jgi:hypothetical protein